MDRTQMIAMVGNIRRAADECQVLIRSLRDGIAASTSNGENTDDQTATLSSLEQKYDRLMADMEKLLDELDIPEASGKHSGLEGD